MDEKIMAGLKNILSEAQVLTGGAIGADYAHDELAGGKPFAPDAVCLVKSTQEASTVLKLCCESGVPVTVRGAGTGQAGGSVPIRGGIVLAMSAMNSILAVDAQNRTMTVQPGALLADVKAEAENNGLYYPPDPGEKTATIGGNAATNASGPCAVKYGRTGDYVLDAVIVKANGQIARLGECAALSSVLGGEGTLGVITELTLKLVDKPKADVILLLPFADTESASGAAKRIMDEGYDPAVLEYLDTDIVEFSGNVTGSAFFPVEMDGERVAATLMVQLEGESDDALDEKLESIAELAEELECLDILVVDSPTMKRDAWAAHAAFHTSMESGARSAWEVNAQVPSGEVVGLIGYAKTVGAANGLKVMAHAHIGSGGVHIHAASELPADEAASAAGAFYDAVYAKVAEMGGDIRGEYGVGYAKSKYLSQAEKDKFTALKAELDPEGILNPGKVVS